MASRIGDVIDLGEPRGRSPEDRQELGEAELCDLLPTLAHGAACPAHEVRLERLQKGVYRLRLAGGSPSFVVKRLTPAIAQADRLVAERWLPALGLGDRCPRLLAAAAQHEGRWVWHAYEDLSGETLAARRERACLEAAVDLMAQLHTRGVGHALLPEVRWHGRDHGSRWLITDLRDGIAALEALATVRTPAGFATPHRRLLERLHRLLEEAPRQIRLMDEAGGADTLLHGDLGPKNVFVALAGERPYARLIDWDHVGVGPVSYDLSTFLYQSSPDDRPWLLRRYRAAVERAGHRLAADGDLNLLFHTAETARGASCVIWPALALLHDGAEWGRSGLADIEDWFETLRPPLPDAAGGGGAA